MATNGEFVSRVMNGIKSLTKDGHVSARWILNIGKTKAKFLMAQKLDEMSLFKEDGLISNIDCFRMKRVKSKECDIVEFRLCDKIMKSCLPLPEGIFGKNGSSVFSVRNIDDSLSYRYITPREYQRRKKRKYKSPNARFFYIKDNHLYILNTTNELVDVSMIALDKDEADSVSECGGSSGNIDCNSIWDGDFICPDKFLDLVARETIQEVASQYGGFVEDENPNLDETQKTKTTR